MFERLTKYIPLLEQTEAGRWVVDRENDGTMEHPIQMPFVAYSDAVRGFIKDVGCFMEENPELRLNRYGDILREHGLEWSIRSMSGATVEEMDANCVCALIVGALRAERFCDGALLSFVKNGSLQRWLRRLQEIDEYTGNNKKESFE